MKTIANNGTDILKQAISIAEKKIEVCNKEIEHLTHPEIYGCCICNCNSIVINKERMMTITTDENHMTKHEFAPIYPTYFSPDAARKIVENDIYSDSNDNIIKLEIIGKLEYYKMLKEYTESGLSGLRGVLETIGD
jgi:hypothetical protein